MPSGSANALAAYALPAGTRFGNYEILRLIAVGGMAEVYLARIMGLEGFQKLVVLKRALPHLAASEDFVRMFLDEARLAATLQHPNVVQVYDIGKVADSYFFTMEFLHGADVHQLYKALSQTKRGGLPIEHALTIVAGAAAGLHHAHDKKDDAGKPLGIVHRDISPSNVFVTFDGSVKVVDFGIAKAASRDARTRTGTLKGKIAYMSPEQVKGRGVDRRSDIFALGILLYELTTGTRLFKGENDFALIHTIASEPVPPPSTRVTRYSAELEAIVLKALMRDREERHQTAEELLEALEAFAARNGLAISTTALGRYLRELFKDRLEAWEQAQAAGVSLADHLTRTSEVPVDLLPSAVAAAAAAPPEPPGPIVPPPAADPQKMALGDTLMAPTPASGRILVPPPSLQMPAPTPSSAPPVAWSAASGPLPSQVSQVSQTGVGGRRNVWPLVSFIALAVAGAAIAFALTVGFGPSDDKSAPAVAPEPSPVPSPSPSPPPSPPPPSPPPAEPDVVEEIVEAQPAPEPVPSKPKRTKKKTVKSEPKEKGPGEKASDLPPRKKGVIADDITF